MRKALRISIDLLVIAFVIFLVATCQGVIHNFTSWIVYSGAASLAGLYVGRRLDEIERLGL